MKRLFFAILLISPMAMLNAQTSTQTAKPAKVHREQLTPEQLAERQTNRAEKELVLDANQKKQYYDFSLARISAIKPLREKARTTTDKAERKKIHEEVKGHRKTFDTNVKGILNAEQLTKYEAAKQKAKEKAKSRAKSKGGPKGDGAMPNPAEEDPIPFED